MTATVIPFRKVEGPQTQMQWMTGSVQKAAIERLGHRLSDDLARRLAEATIQAPTLQK